jgi:hypothetical protein
LDAATAVDKPGILVDIGDCLGSWPSALLAGAVANFYSMLSSGSLTLS